MMDTPAGGGGGGESVSPKPEILDIQLPSDTLYIRHTGDTVASTSGSNLRSSFIGMGFSPLLVDKVIEEKGEDNVDLLLETLFQYSDVQKTNSRSSDSLNSLFGDDENGTDSPPEISTVQPKEELDEVTDEKRASLLMMNFSVNEVEFALNKLGEDAPVNEVVDFIIAAQIAVKFEKETDGEADGVEINEAIMNETLYGTMEKSLRLLQMGFSEQEVSFAIEKLGSEVPISELAELIFVAQTGGTYEADKFSSTAFGTNRARFAKNSRSFGMGTEPGFRFCMNSKLNIKTEDIGPSVVPKPRGMNLEQSLKGKRPKEEYGNDDSEAVLQSRRSEFKESHKAKKPKQEVTEDSNSFIDSSWIEEKVNPDMSMPKAFKSNLCKSLDHMVAKAPYFFYGNVLNVSNECWAKISQFMYAIDPEFVNTQFFSALSRKEGYLHNLPTENRFHILPKQPMNIVDALPHTKKWWPSWDTRRQLSFVSLETSGISQVCERVGNIVADSRGFPSLEQQRDILRQCQRSNLVWVGPYKLGPVEPEHLERVLGYPMNHTQVPEIGLLERLDLLKYCFQTDTLGYHLSVLKSMFPEGVTVLSLLSGIGGVEVALDRLGIRLKGVVSIETCEVKRKILKKWWQTSGQTGELIQKEGIQSLTANKLESLLHKFGGFDFIVCQNPCTQPNNRTSKMAANSDNIPAFDFSLFYEFVRVLQRVRSTMERKR